MIFVVSLFLYLLIGGFHVFAMREDTFDLEPHQITLSDVLLVLFWPFWWLLIAILWLIDLLGFKIR